MKAEKLQRMANIHQKYVAEVVGGVMMFDEKPEVPCYIPQKKCKKCDGTGEGHHEFCPAYDSWPCHECNGTGYVD